MRAQPDFYPRFACKAGQCRHSCCRGWEIDVDEDSAAYYRALPGVLGEALRETLAQDAEGWHLTLDGEERCPFLRRDGLCRLICELGEEALCDICALHPRFFEEIGDWELCGLGLSCEAVTALLLEHGEKLRFLTEDGALTFPELLSSMGIAVEAERLRFVPLKDKAAYAALLDAMAQTEAIDEDWPGEVSALRKKLETAGAEIEVCDRGRYDRIYTYILYRQLDRLGEYRLEELLDYARASTAFVFLQDALEGVTPEHLRRWSEQIEYSTENVALLLSKKVEGQPCFFLGHAL